LISRIIIKIIATRCYILKLKCTKLTQRLQRSPDSLAGFKGPTFKGREGRQDGREGQGREEKGQEGTYF